MSAIHFGCWDAQTPVDTRAQPRPKSQLLEERRLPCDLCPRRTGLWRHGGRYCRTLQAHDPQRQGAVWGRPASFGPASFGPRVDRLGPHPTPLLQAPDLDPQQAPKVCQFRRVGKDLKNDWSAALARPPLLLPCAVSSHPPTPHLQVQHGPRAGHGHRRRLCCHSRAQLLQ